MEVISKVKKFLEDKKGQVFANLSSLATGVAGLAITLVVVFLILSQTAANGTVAADQNASAAIDDLQLATDIIPSFSSIVVIAGVGAVLLSLVALFQASRR